MQKKRVIGVVTIASGVGFVLFASGPARAQAVSTLTNPVIVTGTPVPALSGPIGSAFTNGVSKGKSKGDAKCKVAIQLSGLSLPDSDQTPGTGDEVICTADNSVTVGLALPVSATAVLRGEVKSGKVKIKADLFAQATGCVPTKQGGPGVIQYDGRITCYEPDPAYPNPPIPFASDPTQGVYPAGFAPRPASNLIATEGIYYSP